MSSIGIDELVPVIKEVIATDGEFCLYPRGTSMLPLIVQERDSVTLVKPNDLKKLDIVFYQRKSGQYVLHRIIKIEKDGTFTMCGDNQFNMEKGIEKSQIFAKVIRLNVNSKELLVNSPSYLRYLKTLKFLRFKHRIRTKLRNIKTKFGGKKA